MRDDILLDRDGDLILDENGDLALTDSVRQAVQIRLRWFFSEWRFAPSFGVPWFEEALIKNPNDLRVRQLIRDECMSVNGVIDARNIALIIDPETREAIINLQIATSDQTHSEEVKIAV